MNIDELLFKVITGRATPDEVAAAAAWRGAAAPNEEHYRTLARALSLSLEADTLRTGDPAPRAEDLLASGISRSAAPEPRWHRVRSLRPKLGLSRVLLWAAAVIVALGLAAVWGARLSRPSFGVRELVTGPAEAVTVALRDGTVVRLAPLSRLRVNSRAGDRVVSLTGRGYFAVAKSAGSIFRIQTPSGDVRVLGTRFELEAAREELRVTVVEGRVVVEVGGVEERLDAGQIGRVVRGTPLPPETVSDPAATIDWTENFVAFESTPLRQAARELEHVYGVHIEIEDPVLNDRTLTLHFAHWPLRDAIDAVCLIVYARCSIDEDVVRMVPR